MAIFHVEDDENDALLFRKALAREIPNPITRFQNGQEVIAALKALLHRDAVSLPPLLVIDLKLPCGDGFSVLQWVRSHRELKELPMIVLTAFDRVSDIRRAGELGAMAFFLKENGFSKATEFVRELLSQSAEI